MNLELESFRIEKKNELNMPLEFHLFIIISIICLWIICNIEKGAGLLHNDI